MKRPRYSTDCQEVGGGGDWGRNCDAERPCLTVNVCRSATSPLPTLRASSCCLCIKSNTLDFFLFPPALYIYLFPWRVLFVPNSRAAAEGQVCVCCHDDIVFHEMQSDVALTLCFNLHALIQIELQTAMRP